MTLIGIINRYFGKNGLLLNVNSPGLKCITKCLIYIAKPMKGLDCQSLRPKEAPRSPFWVKNGPKWTKNGPNFDPKKKKKFAMNVFQGIRHFPNVDIMLS